MALLVCLIPTTIGALLSAIGIAGMDRLVQRNVLAMSGRAVEAAGDVNTLLLDKTGTITLGNRQATEFVPVAGVDRRGAGRCGAAASLADETPEGRSIVVLRQDRVRAAERRPASWPGRVRAFTAQTRMSGVDLRDGGAQDPQGRGRRGRGVGPRQRRPRQRELGAHRGRIPPAAEPRWWSPRASTGTGPRAGRRCTSRTW